VNDRWSDLVGDQVLARIAAILVGALRASDRAARYGGEEFVLLPDGGITISIGVAQHHADEVVLDLLGRADAAPLPSQGGRSGPCPLRDLTSSRPRRVGTAAYAGTAAGRRRPICVFDTWARGRTTSVSMLTWCGRVSAKAMTSATSSACSGS